MGQEIELKLSVPPEWQRRLLQHPLIAAAPRQGNARSLFNTYYDTSRLALRAARVALRTRRIGRTWLQTVKSETRSSGGLSTRPEWEQAWRNESFDFSSIDEPATQRLLLKHAEALQPVFHTDFRRSTRIAKPRAGVEIALMFDQGVIRAGQREEAISELELELIQGNPLDLLDFALLLCADMPLLPENASKAERGFALHTQAPLQPARARPSPLLTSMSVHQAFVAQASDLLQDWQHNAKGIRLRDDPEFVHQLRVALRRLRTLLRIFGSTLPAAFSLHWRQQIGALAHGIGETRDLEVLRDEVLGEILAAGYDEGSAQLARRAGEEARLARAAARELLLQPAIGQLPMAFARDLLALAPPVEQTSLGTFAQASLDRLRKQARKHLAQCHDAQEAAAVHALRIRFKRLRYALEFFAPLYDAQRIKRALRATAAVQEHLGYWNDVENATARLHAWSRQDHALIAARAFALGFHAREALRRRDKGLALAHELLEGKRPWRRGSSQ